MRKLAWLLVLVAWFVVPAAAQDTSQNPPPDQSTPQGQSTPESQTTPPAAESPKPKPRPRYTAKYEISAGFAHRSFSTSPGAPKIGMNGWYGSVDYNWKRWLGFAADGLGVYTRINSGLASTYHNQTESIYTFMVGPQFFPFKHRKVTPFGHFLYGGAYFRQYTSPVGGFGSNLVTSFSRAWEGGGGLDVTLRQHWGLRLVEFDYGSTRFFAGSGQSSYRVSVGFVYRFGQR
jgi:hypothetical protein